MTGNGEPRDDLLDILQERAKELNCLYSIDEILSSENLTTPEILEKITEAIPSGFRFPDLCRARIILDDKSFHAPDFRESPVSINSGIKIEDETAGIIEIIYTEEVQPADEGYFLLKEQKLLMTIADRIGQTITYRRMKKKKTLWSNGTNNAENQGSGNPEWRVILTLLFKTDQDMLIQVCRKMINHLSRNIAKEAVEKLSVYSSSLNRSFCSGEINTPGEKITLQELKKISDNTFNLASENMSDSEISTRIQRWMQEEKAYSLVKVVDRIDVSIGEIIDAVTRYHNILGKGKKSEAPSERWLEVALIRRFLSDNPEFIRISRPFLKIDDFYDIVSRLIYPAGSHGKIGGKGTGIFLARRIISRMSEEIPLLSEIKVPKTWYITTDETREFLQYNNLQGLNEQKYKGLEEIRIDYPHIIQLLKNSQFPPGLVKSLAMALDDFGDTPLIVRSSSILEDQIGAAFSGKYKSLFLTNQGTKKDRLDAVMNAITEIYASMYGPDSIQYRAERGMLDFHEEMGILIQEVVGTRVGPYFLPLFAGVAFSNNDYKWSPRIKREDGLIRMVMGLGTRAVDRLNDDFPILISPGQPGLRVNSTPDEIKRYSPKKVDLLNMEENTFESVEILSFIKEYGHLIPRVHEIVSVYRDDYLTSTNAIDINFQEDDLVLTFEGLTKNSPFIKIIKQTLELLKEKIQTPVDIEFASDGKNLYLLQCRPQSSGSERVPGAIPRDLKEKDIIFSAARHISNGTIHNISHIVYVDPDGYNDLQSLDDLAAVGRAVGMLNSLLPRRRFILMGPGRWGSRGDIKLGVQISYSDINNTSALIEIARQKTGYVPELSFGTHFFQDLVEADIRYLPLYPDEKDIIFNEAFLTRSKNILSAVLPDYSHLSKVLYLIDVADSAEGRMLHISMNAEIGEAIGYLAPNSGEKVQAAGSMPASGKNERDSEVRFDDKYWRWRTYMAEKIAEKIDPNRFGVENAYLFGSVNSGAAGPGSDIDMILHFTGTDEQRNNLEQWLEGWSMALGEINYLKTGYTSDGLLDTHIITDEDIAEKTSYTHKIGAVTDPAAPLKLGGKKPK